MEIIILYSVYVINKGEYIMSNQNPNPCCKCTDPQYYLTLNAQGPQGRQGQNGVDGFSPTINVVTNTPSQYVLSITDINGTKQTPNLKGGLPTGGYTGQILTKYGDNDGEVNWQYLPNASVTNVGVTRYSTLDDFSVVEDDGTVGQNETSAITPAGLVELLGNIPTSMDSLFNGAGEICQADRASGFLNIPGVNAGTRIESPSYYLLFPNSMRAEVMYPTSNNELMFGTVLYPTKINGSTVYINGAEAITTNNVATTSTAGIVKPDGTTITIDGDGTLHGATSYNLPTASTTVLGGIKVGDGLSITDDGVLSATGGGGTSLENIKDIPNGIQIMGFEDVPPTGILNRGYFQFTSTTSENTVSRTSKFISEIWENGIKSGSVIYNFLTDYSVTAGTGINVTKKNSGVEISSATGNLKYSTLTSTEYSTLTPDPDTMYRLTDTNQVYLGTIPLTGGASAKQSTFVNYPESSIVKMNTLKSETQVASGYPDSMKIVIGDSTSTSYNIRFLYPGSSLPNADGTGYTSSNSYYYNLNLTQGTRTGITIPTALLYFYNNYVYYTDSLDNIKSYVRGFDASKAIYIGSGSVANGQLQQLTSVPEYVTNNFTGG